MGSRRGECERFRISVQGGTLELLSRGECDSAARRFDSKGGKQCVLDPLQQRWGLEFACRATPCVTTSRQKSAPIAGPRSPAVKKRGHPTPPQLLRPLPHLRRQRRLSAKRKLHAQSSVASARRLLCGGADDPPQVVDLRRRKTDQGNERRQQWPSRQR